MMMIDENILMFFYTQKKYFKKIFGSFKKINPSLHCKTKLKTTTCYAYNYILKQQSALVRQRETITIVGHVILMNSNN
jgi:hypothetical protein